MKNSRAPSWKLWKKLFLSFKALDRWPTFDQLKGHPEHLAEVKTEAQCGARIYREAWTRKAIYCYLLRMYLLLPSGLLPVPSRQLAEGCSRLRDKDPNWKAQGLWLVTFLFRLRSKHKCERSVPRQKLVTSVHVQASLSQRPSAQSFSGSKVQVSLEWALESEGWLQVLVLHIYYLAGFGKVSSQWE